MSPERIGGQDDEIRKDGEEIKKEGDPSNLEIHESGGVRLSLGKEEDILAALRAQGFSEAAIAAFKSGKPIQMRFEDTPFGRYVESEYWQGKEDTPPEEEDLDTTA